MPFKKLEGDSGLQHAGGCNSNTRRSGRSVVKNGIGSFCDMSDEVELEGAATFFQVSLANFFIHQTKVCVICNKALPGHVTKVKDGDIF